MSVPLTPELAFELQAIRDAAYTTTGWKEGYLTLWEGVGAFIEKHSAPSEPREDMTREEEMTEIRQMVGAVKLGANIGGPLVEKLLFEIIGRRSIEEMSAAAVLSAVPSPPSRPLLPEGKQDGLYRKFEVIRTDGESAKGGKHFGCRYFVIDMDHDENAGDALRPYANACRKKRPALADDIEKEFGALPSEHPETIQHEWPEWIHFDGRDWDSASHIVVMGIDDDFTGLLLAQFGREPREAKGLNPMYVKGAVESGARLYAAREEPPSPPTVPDPVDVLRRLYDNQNDCPLPKYQKDWDAAMKDAEAVFAAYDPQPAPPQSKETPASLSPLKEGEALFEGSGSTGETSAADVSTSCGEGMDA